MPVQVIECPRCRTVLTMDAAAGSCFQCPACQTILEIAGAPAVPPPKVAPQQTRTAPVVRRREPRPAPKPRVDRDDSPPIRRRRRPSSGGNDAWILPVSIVGVLGMVLLIGMAAASHYRSCWLAEHPLVTQNTPPQPTEPFRRTTSTLASPSSQRELGSPMSAATPTTSSAPAIASRADSPSKANTDAMLAAADIEELK